MVVAIHNNRPNPLISALLLWSAIPRNDSNRVFPRLLKRPTANAAARAGRMQPGDLSLIKESIGRPCSYFKMASLIYRCPFTGSNVQDWVAEDVSSGEVFVSLACRACMRTHLVNPATGRVLGAADRPNK